MLKRIRSREVLLDWVNKNPHSEVNDLCADFDVSRQVASLQIRAWGLTKLFFREDNHGTIPWWRLVKILTEVPVYLKTNPQATVEDACAYFKVRESTLLPLLTALDLPIPWEPSSTPIQIETWQQRPDRHLSHKTANARTTPPPQRRAQTKIVTGGSVEDRYDGDSKP